MKRWAPLVALSLLVTSCLVETFPDTPGNAAIRFAAALRTRDIDATLSLVCVSALKVAVDFDDPDSFGALAEFYERRQGRSVLGAESEYSAAEEVELTVDEAWTELELVTEDSTETWRLHMVREDGKWKACDAELRP
jgi:hypothetical protein